MRAAGGLGASLPLIPQRWVVAKIAAADLPYDLAPGGANAGALAVSEIVEDFNSGIVWLDSGFLPVTPIAGTFAPFFTLPEDGIWGMELQFDFDKQGGSGAAGTADVSSVLYGASFIANIEDTKAFDTSTQSPCNNHYAIAPTWVSLAGAFPAGLGQVGAIAYAAGLDDLEIQQGLKLRVVKYR